MNPTLIHPFLKWPGGKRWLVPLLKRLAAEVPYARYIEPFLGGGAAFFGLRPRQAILSDVNADLINVYLQVRANPGRLVEQLKLLSVDRDTYLRLRASSPSDAFEAAMRFLYLNRTCFAGVYRLNRKGEFNVPFGGGGRTPSPLWESRLLEDASRALANAVIMASDFEDVLDQAGAGDLVYCDPTYTTAHNQNGFVRYNERNFSWDDQERLARSCNLASGRGAAVLVSNAYHDDIRDLYPEAQIRIVERWSGLPPAANKRQLTQELVLFLEPCLPPQEQSVDDKVTP